VGGLGFTLGRCFDDRNAEQRTQFPRGVEDRRGEALGACGHPCGFDRVARFARLGFLSFGGRFLFVSALDLGFLEFGDAAVEDEDGHQVVFEQFREPLDDADEIGDLFALSGGVDVVAGPPDGGREVSIEPVVCVDRDDRAPKVRKGDRLDNREVP
jgi:hypothetical protein